MYEKRGQSFLLGQIWGLLNLKANSPEKGLLQQEIAEYLDLSISSVSRKLKTLVKMKQVNFIHRRERKYYVNPSFGQIITRRYQEVIEEYNWIKNELIEIKDMIPEEEQQENENLIKQINQMEDVFSNITEIYHRVIEESQELLENI
ncbi:MAG: hypothetical protein ACXAC7_14605 [Candidatus Hodarchaeales archaeon]